MENWLCNLNYRLCRFCQPVHCWHVTNESPSVQCLSHFKCRTSFWALFCHSYIIIETVLLMICRFYFIPIYFLSLTLPLLWWYRTKIKQQTKVFMAKKVLYIPNQVNLCRVLTCNQKASFKRNDGTLTSISPSSLSQMVMSGPVYSESWL